MYVKDPERQPATCSGVQYDASAFMSGALNTVEAKPKKTIFRFYEGNAAQKELLGGKGANLAEMTRIGLPVPPGFTITTEVCMDYLDSGCHLPDGLMSGVFLALQDIEAKTNKCFGDPKNPLLLSVRSGAQFSMPGMMETILNLGLNDHTLEGLITQTANARFAYDSYRRFISMFANVVFHVEARHFENLLDIAKKQTGLQSDTQLTAEQLQEIVDASQALFQSETGRLFPQDPTEQLQLAIQAVFESWRIPRAVTYRNYHKISHRLGTAVNIQAMVFGNMGNDSASGVAFTRNPATGEKALYGEYLVNCQGEDVVAGIRTPKALDEMKAEFPDGYQQLLGIAKRLESHFKEVQDIEFTIENNRLYMLQTRTGKRTVQAAVKIAADMVSEGLISKEDALLQVDANQVHQMLMPGFQAAAKAKAQEENRLLTRGINASPGAAVGIIVFNPDEVEDLVNTGENVILVRPETSPDDIHGILYAQGVLTSKGGNTSHAAVVTRGMGKPCIVGCSSCEIDMRRNQLKINGQVLQKGDVIAIDGTSGEVFRGSLETEAPKTDTELSTLLAWADSIRKLNIRANADTPQDATSAISWGAQGIGLCRTEHMFMDPDRLPLVQAMILAETTEERQKALWQLLPMQLEDFRRIFQVMAGLPVTIRLLDPPLHEFLPSHDNLLEEVVHHWCNNTTGPELERKEALLKKVAALREANPMMGFRGCRIGLIYPEIYDMQVEAIFKAAITLKKQGADVQPEIMIPLVSHVSEVSILRQRLEALAEDLLEAAGVSLPYQFGTMIELPRAALTADEIAAEVDFFSFGTNDLTQMTFGFSRDDAEKKFLKDYLDRGILSENPFETLDQAGVGQLIKTACRLGRESNPGLKLGLCGEHGGDARSIAFCHQAGLDYVSCSPYRVPTARLAAAQAVLLQNKTLPSPSTPRI